MNKKTVAILICVGAVVLGACAAYWVNRAPIPTAIEKRHTDQLAREIEDTIETVTARLKQQHTKTKTEVRVIHETIRTKVNALPPDSVAAGLNSELALFRGMESGAGGMDD